jgi:hypothetical protein
MGRLASAMARIAVPPLKSIKTEGYGFLSGGFRNVSSSVAFVTAVLT